MHFATIFGQHLRVVEYSFSLKQHIFIIHRMGSCTNKKQSIMIQQSSQMSQADRIPYNPRDGVNIVKNPLTNKLQGVPEEWIGKYNFPFQIDMDKIVKTSHLPAEIRPDEQLPPALKEFLKNKKLLKTSGLFFSKSRIQSNLKVDLKQPLGIINIPSDLLQQITDSSITDEVISDKNSFIEVITNYGNEMTTSKIEKELLTTSEFKIKLKNVSFIQEKPGKDYHFMEELGKGSMCKVYKAKDKLNSSLIYAVRIIAIDQNQRVDKLKEEITAMLLCQSENIIKYKFSYLYDETLFMFIEYMEFGALSHFITAHKKSIPQNVISFITRQILKGLLSIHKRRQLHRDLKSDNILVNSKGEIKISDFGYALQFTKQKTSSRQMVGTPAWMAPQLIKKEDYNESVDIWSLGIIVVELCEGEPKYLRMKPLKAMYMIVSQPPQTVKGRSADLTDFVDKCLRKNAAERATVAELLGHPFILSIGSGIKERQQFLQMYKKVD